MSDKIQPTKNVCSSKVHSHLTFTNWSSHIYSLLRNQLRPNRVKRNLAATVIGFSVVRKSNTKKKDSNLYEIYIEILDFRSVVWSKDNSSNRPRDRERERERELTGDLGEDWRQIQFSWPANLTDSLLQIRRHAWNNVDQYLEMSTERDAVLRVAFTRQFSQIVVSRLYHHHHHHHQLAGNDLSTLDMFNLHTNCAKN